MTTERIHLQPWYDRWLKEYEDSNLIYARLGEKVLLRQVHFVRDTLAPLVWADVPYEKRALATPRYDIRETAIVVGEHHSKSVRLPVYAIERPDLGLRLVMRDNYYDWNVSIASEREITSDLRGFPLDYWNDGERSRFPNGYRPGMSWGYCFFQGFPLDAQFGPYAENHCRFSMCVRSDYQIFTLIWILMRDLREETKR
jgi:hypothetical protein